MNQMEEGWVTGRDWAEANKRYLMDAVGVVREELESYVENTGDPSGREREDKTERYEDS